MKYFQLVWSALLRRKARTLFTLVSILTAFLLFGMLDSVRTAFADVGRSVSGARELITLSKLGMTQQLPLGLSLGPLGQLVQKMIAMIQQVSRLAPPGSKAQPAPE